MEIQPKQVLELIWIAWLISWVAASFWSGRTQKRAATVETWTYRAAMIAGGALLVPWTGPLLEEKQIWEIGWPGAIVLTAILVAGLLLTWWARIYLGSLWSSVITRKEGHKIVDTGPYALVRHPIYTSHLLMGLGTPIASGLLLAFAGLLFFFIGFCIKLKQEESLLLSHFPDEYPAYKARVKALVPFVF